MFKKMYVYAFFAVLTTSNFLINPPGSARASCSCPDGCTGDCCNGTPCGCYAIGAGGCKATDLGAS